MDDDEKRLRFLKKSNKIYSVEKIIPTIYLVSELSRNKNIIFFYNQ